MTSVQTPLDDNYKPIQGWDATNHVPAVPGITSTALDGNVRYGTPSIAISNANANGQATMANSSPVVVASDQSAIAAKRSAVSVYSLASTLENANGNSGDLSVGAYTEIGIDINTTAHAGTNPTVQFFWNRKGADGLYYALWQSAVLSSATNTLSTSIGAGMAYAQSLGITGQFSWVIGGSASPSVTFSINIYGK